MDVYIIGFFFAFFKSTILFIPYSKFNFDWN